MILTNNLLPEEHRRVWEPARIQEIHQTIEAHLPGAEVVPEQEPHWDYNTPVGILAGDQFMTCILSGLHKAASSK